MSEFVEAVEQEFDDPLGDLDERWPSARLKFVTEINPDSLTGEESEDWMIDYVDISSVNNRGEIQDTEQMPFGEAPSRAQRLVQAGDTIVSTVRTYLRAIAFVESPPSNQIVSTGFAVLRPSEKLYPQFLWRCLQADPFVEWIVANSKGVSYPAINPSRLGDLVVPLPPLEEQQRIVSFLSQKVTQINTLIDKKRALIDLLEEKRVSKITELTSNGLNPNPLLKSPDSRWFDQIPAHWEIIRLKFLLDNIEQGWSPKCEDRPASSNEWGVLKAGAVNNGVFHEDENKALPEDKSPKPEYEITEGNLIMNRASGSPDLIGSVAIVPKVRSNLLLCDKLYRLHVRENIAIPEYLYNVLRSKPLRHQIVLSISGAEGLANNIPQGDLKEFVIPVPPLQEQEEIVQNTRRWESKLDSLITQTRKATDLLQEKRQALITKAVTGQIDVTEQASHKEKETEA